MQRFRQAEEAVDAHPFELSETSLEAIVPVLPYCMGTLQSGQSWASWLKQAPEQLSPLPQVANTFSPQRVQHATVVSSSRLLWVKSYRFTRLLFPTGQKTVSKNYKAKWASWHELIWQ